MRRVSSIFVRSVISFFSIALLATSLLSLYFTQRISAAQYEAQLEKYRESFESLCALLDDRFYDYLSYASIVNNQKELRPYYFSANDFLSHKDIIEALQTLKASNRSVVDIGLYYMEGERYISAIASFDDDSFVRHYYHFSGLDGQEYLTMLKDPRGASQENAVPLIIPVGKATRMDTVSSIDTLLILYPLPYWSQAPYASLSIIVDAQSMLKQLSLAAGSGSAYIQNAAGQTILRYDAAGFPAEEGAPVHVFQDQSEKFNLVYSMEIGEDVLSRAGGMVQGRLYFMLVGITVLLSICGLLFALWVYRPMQRLMSSIGGKGGLIRDEASVIWRHITELDAHVAHNQRLADELLLRRLMAGHHLPAGIDLQRQGSALALDYGHSAVFAVKLAQAPAQAISLTEIEQPRAAVYIIQGEREDVLVGIISTDEAEEESLLARVRDILGAALFAGWTVAAVGPAQEDLSDLGRSALYAQGALSQMEAEGKRGIYAADERLAVRDEQPQEDPAENSDEHLLALISQIDGQLEHPDFGITYMAQQYGMSDSAFSHMFKRAFGISFIAYVNRMKIRRAKRLLKETALSIDEIARRMGYSSASNFTRMFRSIEQITPSLYRRMNAEEPGDDSESD